MPAKKKTAHKKATKQKLAQKKTARAKPAVRKAINKNISSKSKNAAPESQDISDRQQVEEALRKERDFAESLIDTARAIVLVLDPEGHIVRFNSYMEELSGYHLDEVIGKDWFTTFLPARDQKRTRALFSKAIEDFPTNGNVNPIVSKDGHERIIEWHDKTLKDAQGNVIGLLVTGQDITRRKQAEDELRASEARYRSVIQQMAELVCRFNPDFTLTFVNQAYCRYFGKSEQALLGKSFFSLIPEDSWDSVRQHFASFTPDNDVQTIQHRVIESDGSIRWQQWTNQAFFDKNGKVLEFQASGADITERKLMEDQLRASESDLRGVLDSLQDIYYRTDKNDYIINASPSSLQVTGYLPEELIGKPITQFWRYPEKRQEMLALMQASDGLVQGFEIEGIHKDGHYVWGSINAHFYYDQQGEIKGVEGTIRDISKSKQVERALREERDKTQRYLDTVEAIIVALDRQGRITLLNRKGCEMLGIKEEEALGSNWFETCLPQPEGKELVEKVFHEIMDGQIEKAEYFENPVITPNGEQRLIAWHNSYLHDEDNNIIGTLSSGEDITERRQWEEQTTELLKQNRELTQRIFQMQEEERQYLARELHDEFGQWLTAIQLDAQNIHNLIEYPSLKIEESINSIITSARQIHEGIRSLIHSLRPPLLDELGLADSLNELINQWQKHNPDIDCQLSITGDLDKLGKNLSITVYRLVQEALNNVAKHAQASRVEVKLERTPVKSRQLDNLLLTIEDDGRGIDPDITSRGFGLPGMRERVLSSGGTFNVSHSRLGTRQKGTRIEARFEINA
jgi:PAS domain S-box-containing protein